MKILFFSILFAAGFAIVNLLSFCVEHKSKVDAQINRSVSNKNENTNQTIVKKEPSEVPSPTIVSRKEWKAKDPVRNVKEHTIRYITIHHTATLQKTATSIEKKMQSLQNFSQSKSLLATGKMKPVWFDVPYHFYIAFDGKMKAGTFYLSEIQTPTMTRPDTRWLCLRETLKRNSPLPNNSNLCRN